MEGSLAKRYSTAFFNIAKKQNKVEELYNEFSDFFDFFDKNEKLKIFILSKEISVSDKTETINQLFGSQLSPETVHFLFLILRKKREYLFENVMYHFKKLYLEYKNIEEARIYSTHELPGSDIKPIEAGGKAGWKAGGKAGLISGKARGKQLERQARIPG